MYILLFITIYVYIIIYYFLLLLLTIIHGPSPMCGGRGAVLRGTGGASGGHAKKGSIARAQEGINRKGPRS